MKRGPAGLMSTRDRQHHAGGVADRQHVGLNPRGQLLELALDRPNQLGAGAGVGAANFGLVGVDRRFQRRALGQDVDLRLQLARLALLQRRQHALAGGELVGDRAPDVAPALDGDQQQHRGQDDRHDREHRDRGPNDQAGRAEEAADHRSVSIGSANSTRAVRPGSTLMVFVLSPIRSCHALI